MDELKQYVEDMKKQGYSSASIKSRLEKEGFHESHVNEAMKTSPLTTFLAILLVITCLVILGVGLFQLLSESDQALLAPKTFVQCYDRDCITTRALDCLPTTYNQRESTSLVQYKVDGCKLQKKIIQIDDSENAVIKNYFLNKDMVCKYPRDQFKRSWLLGITSNMEDCYGSLRDAIELL